MSTKLLTILLDYDNLERLDKSRGLYKTVEKIIAKTDNLQNTGKTNINVRVYGGWYNEGNITKRAQDLTVEINKDFPSVIIHPSSGYKMIVNAELAFGLLIAPKEHVLATYRFRSFPTDLKCDDPTIHGCTSPTCPIHNVYNFIKHGSISGQCCDIKPKNILYKGEQKLVDSMITTDVFYLTMNNESPIILVSSDDDFWPAIRTSLELETQVIHVHTKQAYQTPNCYLQFANSFYQQIKI